jgi:hypothetical protein
LVKIGQKYLCTAREDQSKFHWCRRHYFSINAVLWNIQYVCIFSVVWLPNTQITRSFFSVVTMVTWTRHSVTLYLHSLFCSESSKSKVLPLQARRGPGGG